MNSEIILIGPIGIGKTTIGKLLAEKLKIPQITVDDVRTKYYKEIGYDEELAKFWSLYQYWKPFEAHAVERLLSQYKNCVIDFGAGHSVYEDEMLFKRIQKILAPYQNVILLLPSSDPAESMEILNERLNERAAFLRNLKPNINEHFLKHHSNYDLAKFIVYTKGKTPEETCEEILRLISK